MRNIWSNLAAYNLNLWMHTLAELWAWDKNQSELVDRRKALRSHILHNELTAIITKWSLPQKIIQLAKTLINQAV